MHRIYKHIILSATDSATAKLSKDNWDIKLYYNIKDNKYQIQIIITIYR